MRPASLYLTIQRRHRRRDIHAQSLLARFSKAATATLAVSLVLLSGAIIALAFEYASLTRDLPSLALLEARYDIQKGSLLQPTRFYDRSGMVLIYSLENSGVTRRFLTLDASRGEMFSAEIAQVAVWMNEPGFWQSPGISWQHLTDPQPVTIAEKVALTIFPDGEPANLRRALRMRLLAAQLVQTYGRSRVLEWYLNSLYFGRLAFGADTAARLYLGIPASQVNFAEAALLLTTAQAPALNPFDAPAAALERQQAALAELRKHNFLIEDVYQRAKSAPIKIRPAPEESQNISPAFIQLSIDQLNRQIGRDVLERGGLRVITTLDANLQSQLSCLIQNQVKRLATSDSDSRSTDDPTCPAARLLPTLTSAEKDVPSNLSASGVLLDVKTAQVLALVGETSIHGQTPMLGAYAPGSLFSPVVAVAAFARGYSPASLMWDIPSNSPDTKLEDTANRVNPDGKYHGAVRLRTALVNDYLTPITGLLEQVGANNIIRLAETLGMPDMAHPGVQPGNLLYNGGKTSLLQVAQTYSIFASLGQLHGKRIANGFSLEPVIVLYVEDASGLPILDQRTSDAQSLLSAPLAYLTHHVLADNAARWASLGYPNPLEIGRPAGAKIGRVVGNQGAWTVGYTPQLLSAFWLGIPGDKPDDQFQVDPRAVASLWYAYMQHTHRSLPSAGWQAPAGISTLDVCDPSGLLPTTICPAIVNEVFLTGNEPTSPDYLYRVFQVNRETGLLATVFTPPAMVENRTFMVIPPEARTWARENGIPLPPTAFDVLQMPLPSPDVRINSPSLFAAVSGQVSIRGTAAGEGFSSYRVQVGQGLNPQTWIQVGSEQKSPVKDGELAVWDTSGREGLYAVRLVVVRQDQKVETAIIQVTVDNAPPTIRVLSPSNGQVFWLPAEPLVTLRAEVIDSIGISRVEWIMDGVSLGERAQPPYSLPWETQPGEHTLLIRAQDTAGNKSASPEIRFKVESQPTSDR
ncbi:MAG TPA: transglycosylase domain-containing protein [Anaerolineaceae bacterium]